MMTFKNTLKEYDEVNYQGVIISESILKVSYEIIYQDGSIGRAGFGAFSDGLDEGGKASITERITKK